jgi:hypothetical protein
MTRSLHYMGDRLMLLQRNSYHLHTEPSSHHYKNNLDESRDKVLFSYNYQIS